MQAHRLLCGMLVVLVAVSWPLDALGWGKGHRLIRLWAVARLPQWQRELVGQRSLDRLCKDYTSLQDKHAGGNAPELDPYCIVPGVRLSLHDVNAAEPSAKAVLWYLDRITEKLSAGDTDEAMKFLGVLCHWNEDPGCPGAHSSSVSEVQLKTLLPPPKDKARFNYLYGAGGIMDTGDYRIADVAYQPRLLGRTRAEAALRILQHQRLLRQDAGTHIIPIVQDMMYGDGSQADQHRAAAALVNARHTADVIYTTLCLATDRFDAGQPTHDEQPLSEWLPDFGGRMIPHPYYVTPFLVNQAMDAKRQLHPLALGVEQPTAKLKFGYGMGTPFSLDFVLAPGQVFDRFTCRVGLHPTAGPAGAVVFAITANGQELARTSVLKSGEAAVAIDVALPRAEVLKLSLQTIAGKDSNSSHNLSVWAEPLLHRRR
ncbi:MAG: NPCBM/NEW2 domain-containing protein [Planctomycetaceae bacterium]